MAASVRIEDEAFADARVELLGELAGYNRYEALGRLAHLWRLCTQRQTHVVSEALVKSCLGPKGADALVDAELGERADGGVRIKGTDGRIEWLLELSSTRQHAGRIRAATARRDSRGRLLSSSTVQQTSSTTSNTGTNGDGADDASQHTNNSPAGFQQTSSRTPARDQQNSSTRPANSSAPAPAPAPALKEEREGTFAPRPPSLSADSDSKRNRKPKRPEIPIPADWEPAESAAALATELNLDLQTEARTFRDHALSKARLLVDWQAGFRTWLTRSAEYRAQSNNGVRGRPNGTSSPQVEFKPL